MCQYSALSQAQSFINALLQRPNGYWLAAVVPLLQLAALLSDGPAAVAWVPTLAFIVIPLADLALGRPSQTWSARHVEASRTPSLGALPYVLVALHVGCVVLAARLVAHDERWIVALAWSVSIGICTGFGLNAAHVLGHRRERLPRLVGQLMTLNAACMHMPHEHAIHHGAFGTWEDHGTPRPGEGLYVYAWRYYIDGFMTFWRRESKTLTRSRRQKTATYSHRGLRYVCLPMLYGLAMSAALDSGLVFPFFLTQAVIGTFMMALGNYVAHYGMLRQRRPDGSYLAGDSSLAWNCDYLFSNFVLLGLPRHSDHHQHPSRAFLYGKDRPEAPSYPFPYSCMAVLSTLPPLWRYVMDPLLSSPTVEPRPPIAPHVSLRAQR